MKSLEQILGHVSLTGLVEDVKTGVPDVFPKALFTTKVDVLKDQGRYTRYSGTRKTSKRVEYGGGSIRRELSPIGSFDVKLNHVFEHIVLNAIDYQSLRNYTDYNVQRMGIEEVKRQAFQFRQLIDNTRISMVASMLAKGAIYWDSEGNLLPSSSGAAVTESFQITAANQNQLGGIIAASWSLPATDIPAQLRALKKRARQLTGYPLKYAFYGENVPSHLTANTAVQAYLSRNPVTHQKFLDTAELPDLFGFVWIPVYESFFEDSAGTNQAWFGVDQVTFAPEIDSSVYEWMEGTYPVPTTLQPLPTLEAGMAGVQLKNGIFAYAVPVYDPAVSVKLFAGDTSLPVWKVPDALFLCDTTP